MDKPKFNILDGVIIAAVVLVIAAGIFLLGRMGAGNASNAAANTNVVFKIQLTRAEQALADKFILAKENQETVRIGLKERFSASVTEVEVKPAEEMVTDLRTGKAVLASDPTSVDITITVKAEAVETDSSITAGTTAIRVGEEAAIRGKDFAGYGFIIGLETEAE